MNFEIWHKSFLYSILSEQLLQVCLQYIVRHYYSKKYIVYGQGPLAW